MTKKEPRSVVGSPSRLTAIAIASAVLAAAGAVWTTERNTFPEVKSCSPDGSRFLSCIWKPNGAASLEIRDTKSGKPCCDLSGFQLLFDSLRWSSDGTRVAAVFLELNADKERDVETFVALLDVTLSEPHVIRKWKAPDDKYTTAVAFDESNAVAQLQQRISKHDEPGRQSIEIVDQNSSVVSTIEYGADEELIEVSDFRYNNAFRLTFMPHQSGAAPTQDVVWSDTKGQTATVDVNPEGQAVLRDLGKYSSNEFDRFDIDLRYKPPAQTPQWEIFRVSDPSTPMHTLPNGITLVYPVSIPGSSQIVSRADLHETGILTLFDSETAKSQAISIPPSQFRATPTSNGDVLLCTKTGKIVRLKYRLADIQFW